jgi:hypothetical protein
MNYPPCLSCGRDLYRNLNNQIVENNGGREHTTARCLEIRTLPGLQEALKVMEAMVMEGFVKEPFESMKPTEVKQLRDDMHSGAIKMFEAVRARIKEIG